MIGSPFGRGRKKPKGGYVTKAYGVPRIGKPKPKKDSKPKKDPKKTPDKPKKDPKKAPGKGESLTRSPIGRGNTKPKGGYVTKAGGVPRIGKKRPSLKDTVAEIKAMRERSKKRQAEKNSKKPSKRAQTILQRMREKRKTLRRGR